MQTRFIGIGTLGLMLSPAAKHLSNSDYQFIRIHDRGTQDERRDLARQDWRDHGAELIGDFEGLVGNGQFEGVVICSGKNGDDLNIIKTLCPLLQSQCKHPPFILHLSTVSVDFVKSIFTYCQELGIHYLNYPLTGGPVGARNASMLILASGDQAWYHKLHPMLSLLGNPRYFGDNISAGCEVKLIGHLMVFNGLLGISSAAALHSSCLNDGSLGGESQTEFFEFLNQGAGGTRQWDIALRKGIADEQWEQGFMIQHAVVDTLYCAQLTMQKGLSKLVTLPLLMIARAFTHLLVEYPDKKFATHALVKGLLAGQCKKADEFIWQIMPLDDLSQALQQCVNDLPEPIQSSVQLKVNLY